MKWLILLLLVSPVWAQPTYTAIQIVTPPAVGTAIQEPGINKLANSPYMPVQTMATYTNGSTYIGWLDLGNGPANAVVWFGGLQTEPYVLLGLIVGDVIPGAILHANGIFATGIDQNGNIIVEGDTYTTNPPSTAYWILIPTVDPMQSQLDAANAQIASLQKQLTHVTSQMTTAQNLAADYLDDVRVYLNMTLELQHYIYLCRYHKGPC